MAQVTVYHVFCSDGRSKSYHKTFDNLNEATAFYDRACAKWEDVILKKYVHKKSGGVWMSVDTKNVYYNNRNILSALKEGAVYRNIYVR